MGTSTIPVTTGNTRTLQAEYIASVRGRITSVSAFVIEATISDAQIYTQIGTMLGGRGREFRKKILAAGYLGSTTAVSWDGSLPLQETEEVYVYIWASTAASFILRIDTED